MAKYLSNRDGGKTNEEGHYRFQTKVWDGNILEGLSVVQNSPLGMTVLVGSGDLKIDYSEYAYTAWNDSDSSVTIETADGSNPRIDRIVAYIDRGETPTTASPNNPGLLKFKSVAGVPAGSPSRPNDTTVQASVGASNPYCDLADVLVNASASTITNSNITDTRTFITLPNDIVKTAAVEDGAITTPKIADGAVTGDKLASEAILLGIGRRSIDSNTSLTTYGDTLLNVSVDIPSTKKVELEAFIPLVYNTVSGGYVYVSIWRGAIGSGTMVAEGSLRSAGASMGSALIIKGIDESPPAGSNTYNVAFKRVGGSSAVLSFSDSSLGGYISAKSY